MKLEQVAVHDGRPAGVVAVVEMPEEAQPAPEAPPARRNLYRDVFKRWLDIAVVVLAAPILVPLVGVFALLVTSDGGGPFYRQERVGRGGRTYSMWKLRSMVPDAEAALAAHLAADPEARAEWEHHQKLRNDPRITPVGRFLRTYSLDELPQFWNVLTGDMSLVGPRPMLPEQERLYPGRSYFALRPGITGPWQVSDRHATSFAERAGFDDGYLRRVSLWTDLRLIAATVRVVLRGTGC